jgi:spermidine/putrescine-binding protein
LLPSPLSRRQFLATAAGLTAGLVGCGKGGKAGPFAGRELRVFVYAGGHDKTMREVFVPAFEQETGATVSLSPGWWDGVPKLKAAPENNPPFDLLITDATQGYPAAREGLFAQIDLANVPNSKHLAPSSLDNWIFRDRLGLPYPDSVMTLAFNKKQAGEAPARWADLLRPDLANKIGLYNAFYMSLYTFACVQADQAGRAGTAREWIEKKLDDVLKFARENRGRVKLWWPTSTDMILALAGGECAAGNMHSPEYLTALREKPDLAATVPDADRAFVQVFWAIPAGTRNKDLAEKAIDSLFSDEVQLGFARRGSATAVPAVAERMAAEDPLWKQLYPHTEEQFRSLRYYPYEVYAEHWDHLADQWDRTVLRKG